MTEPPPPAERGAAVQVADDVPPHVKIDTGESGMPATLDGSDTEDRFQWPPPDDGSAGEVVSLRTDALSRLVTTASLATSAPPPPKPSVKDLAVVPRPRIAEAAPFEPGMAFADEDVPASQRAATGSGWLTLQRGLTLAFTVLTLIAIGEGIYIIRQARPAGGAGAGTGTVAPPPAPVLPAAPAPAAGAAAAATVVRTAQLSIRSTPTGAHVLVDGRLSGVTPLDMASVEPGDHQVVLMLDGRNVQQTVHVEAGAAVSLVVPMGASPAATAGWVAVTAPLDLDILEGGVVLGTTRSPQVMLAAGSHTLHLTHGPTGYDAVQQVRIEPGKVARLQVQVPESLVQLNAQPWADVWVDGKSVGETPIGDLHLPIGPHEFVFRHPELGEKTVSAMVKASGPTRVTADLRK